jgi:hypothetical protein
MTREVGQGSGSSERMGGYDQFSSLQFYILHIIYIVCSFVLSYYNMLYLSVLILQSSCLYCYLFISSCFAIIHEPCLYTYFIYMIYVFHMLCVLMIHIVMDIFEITFFMFNYLLYVIIVMLIYEIKMIQKMPIFLTVGRGRSEPSRDETAAARAPAGMARRPGSRRARARAEQQWMAVPEKKEARPGNQAAASARGTGEKRLPIFFFPVLSGGKINDGLKKSEQGRFFSPSG